MKVSAQFQNGMCKLFIRPEDDWEKRLLGAVAKGGVRLDAIVTYTPEGHFSYERCEVVEVQLEATRNDPNPI